MDLYGGLPDDEIVLPEEITEVCASLLNQYIEEDGIIQDDSEDRRVEKLMRFSELYFVRFLRVTKLLEISGPDGVINWQKDKASCFFEHSKVYHKLYSQIKHMADAPYFMTNWSMCYLVSTSLDVMEINSQEQYENISEDESSELDYILRFGENLLQKFRTEVM